ncbi:MraY family glycosyltransferase [Thermobrachium celere]|uniref:MraY family glycosyltransferase n=1 Tax=Thermobrachium celere TaxID=53422 RepID=UPI001940D5F7|nr:hypothetical protein TCEA9_20470 [Thermobrachium celere]
MLYFIVYFFTLLNSLFFTHLTFKIINSFSIGCSFDKVNSINKPRLDIGNISVFITFWVSVFLIISIDKQLLGILLGSTIILIMGIIDDLKKLKSITKLLVQFAVVLILILFDIRITKIGTTRFIGNEYLSITYLGIIFTILWIIGIINSLELINKSEIWIYKISLFISLLLFFVSILFNNYYISIFSIVIAGLCTGQLIYNYTFYKIKLGNAGLQFLGFILSIVPILDTVKVNSCFQVFDNIIIFGLIFFSLFKLSNYN